MANVGNLFVNISGNTKGLTKSLGKAKRSIQRFGKEVMSALGDGGSMSGKAAKRASGMYGILGAEIAGRRAQGDLKGAKQTQKMQALFKPGAEQHERYTQAKARLVTSATLGVLGLTVAGVSMMASKALSQISSAKAGAEKFKYLGPKGGEIIAAELAIMKEDMKAAQKESTSTAILKKTEAELAGRKKANEGGGVDLSLAKDTALEMLGTDFMDDIARIFSGDFHPLLGVFDRSRPVMVKITPQTTGAAPP